MAQHLPNRPAADAEPPARLTMAQTFVDNRKPYRRMELHAVHPLLLAETDKGPWMAINLRRRDRTARPLPVKRYRAAVNCIGHVHYAHMARLPEPVRSALAGDFA